MSDPVMSQHRKFEMIFELSQILRIKSRLKWHGFETKHFTLNKKYIYYR